MTQEEIKTDFIQFFCDGFYLNNKMSNIITLFAVWLLVGAIAKVPRKREKYLHPTLNELDYGRDSNQALMTPITLERKILDTRPVAYQGAGAGPRIENFFVEDSHPAVNAKVHDPIGTKYTVVSTAGNSAYGATAPSYGPRPWHDNTGYDDTGSIAYTQNDTFRGMTTNKRLFMGSSRNVQG
jgi:hypothetical protein